MLRTVAAGALEGRRHGRWLRELSKGDVTDGGCGGLRGVSRAVAACSRRPWCPPKLSAAVGRVASLRPFRSRRPWRLPSSLPLPSAVTPSEDFRCRRPWRLPSSLPLPSAVAPPFVPSAAVGRNASLRSFRCRRPQHPPKISAAVGRNASLRSFRCRRPQHPPKISAAVGRGASLISLSHRCKYALVALRQFGA